MPVYLSVKGYTNEIDFKFFVISIGISTNSKPKSKRPQQLWQGSMPNRIMSKNWKSISLVCIFNNFTINTHTGLLFWFYNTTKYNGFYINSCYTTVSLAENALIQKFKVKIFPWLHLFKWGTLSTRFISLNLFVTFKII